MKNPTRFWTGIVMGGIEVLALGIFGLTLLNWAWVTTQVIFASMISLAVVLYNVIAGILIWFGSKGK